MGLYGRCIYPHVTKFMNRCVGTHPRIVDIAHDLFGQVRGTVLEIGIGTGATLPLYDAACVNKVYGLDPHPGMIKMTRRVANTVPLDVELLNESAEAISLNDQSVDTVLSNFTFCTIPDLPRALAEMRRVLKPGGRLVFFEHGLSPEPTVQRWQHFEEPFHGWLFQGCHTTREIPQAIEATGFTILRIDTEYLPRCPKAWGYTWRGVAAEAGS